MVNFYHVDVEDELTLGATHVLRTADAGMPLSMVKAGETVRVSRVKGNEDMKHHLKDLGFVEGNEIHVVSSSGANIIVTVLGARFGIDSKVAMHIMTVG